MSTSHPRRSTISLTSRPSAPQITNAVLLTSRAPDARMVRSIRRFRNRKARSVRTIRRIEVWEAQHGDERVVEVGAARKLDVLDARRELERDLALAVGEERDLRALPGRVADGDDAVDVDRRHEADYSGALGVEVGAERPSQQHLVQVLGPDAKDVHQYLDPGRDRALGELELADVALGQVDAVREQERTHAVDLDQPVAKRVVGNVARRPQPPGVVEQTREQELCHRVDEPGAADPLRGDVAADDLKLHA